MFLDLEILFLRWRHGMSRLASTSQLIRKIKPFLLIIIFRSFQLIDTGGAEQFDPMTIVLFRKFMGMITSSPPGLIIDKLKCYL